MHLCCRLSAFLLEQKQKRAGIISLETAPLQLRPSGPWRHSPENWTPRSIPLRPVVRRSCSSFFFSCPNDPYYLSRLSFLAMQDLIPSFSFLFVFFTVAIFVYRLSSSFYLFPVCLVSHVRSTKQSKREEEKWKGYLQLLCHFSYTESAEEVFHEKKYSLW